jgi:hypothetical protein
MSLQTIPVTTLNQPKFNRILKNLFPGLKPIPQQDKLGD